MKKFYAGVVALSVLGLTACGGNEPEKKTTSSDPGAEIYANNSCVGCHGRDLEGASGPNLQKVGSKLSEKEIHDIIINGKGSMPGKVVDGEDADKVAKYLAKQK
ncbi:cytochrome c551 [Macrococcus armenti]|uniref:cytochrome c551 n=1 Tax=Macrococcus armenti TaxID=2875764 RepID=UPI001CCE304B|nr:cytochrome c [Macrococcus armenti]UBH15944.1 cytochrome c [Macrococcus armenti]UBH20571.1 cytochrome c [Macrococcus armenti]